MRRAIITALALMLALPVCAWANDYDHDEWVDDEWTYADDAAWVTPEEFREQGVIYADDGTWYTYYNDEDAPDGFEGYLDEQGVWRDWDGYVCCAGSYEQYMTVVDTPMGLGICYDICPSGAIDVWTCWD